MCCTSALSAHIPADKNKSCIDVHCANTCTYSTAAGKCRQHTALAHQEHSNTQIYPVADPASPRHSMDSKEYHCMKKIIPKHIP